MNRLLTVTKTRVLAAGTMLGLAAAATIPAAAQMEDVVIKAEKVAGNVYVLYGQGGNIGASIGDDGIFLIDDQFAPLTDKIKAKLAELSDKPIKFVINTHYHGDHSGGNENLGKAGTVIVAHDNVRQRMAKGAFLKAFNFKMDPAPKVALPVVTFSDALSLHLNGEETRAHHVKNAHTDGDSIIHFQSSNVLHMGDTFFFGRYPYVDVEGGGSLDGVIMAVEKALKIADDQTKIIPGHGLVTDKKGLQGYHSMLLDIKARFEKAVADGIAKEELQKSDILKGVADYAHDDDWAVKFIGFIYDSVAASQ